MAHSPTMVVKAPPSRPGAGSRPTTAPPSTGRRGQASGRQSLYPAPAAFPTSPLSVRQWWAGLLGLSQSSFERSCRCYCNSTTSEHEVIGSEWQDDENQKESHRDNDSEHPVQDQGPRRSDRTHCPLRPPLRDSQGGIGLGPVHQPARRITTYAFVVRNFDIRRRNPYWNGRPKYVSTHKATR